MADNGDFAKISGPLSLGVAEPEQGTMLHAAYLRDERFYYKPGVRSSEAWLASAASRLAQIFGNPRQFDIRWMGFLHGLIFLGVYFSILSLLRPLPVLARCVLSLAALWIFADVGLLAYLNSFYSDVPAALGGLAVVFLGVGLLSAGRVATSTLVVFTLAAFLFITSKAQHGLFGFLPAAVAILCGWRALDLRVRVVGYLAGLTLLAATVWIVASTPDWYQAQSRFNLIFLKIMKRSDTPVQDLEELGLAAEDARFVGLHAYSPGGPLAEPRWAADFSTRTSYGRVMRFYLRHPWRALAILRQDLDGETSQRYSPGFSSFEARLQGAECTTAELGEPQCSPASGLGTWGTLRSMAFRAWPAHVAVWFGVVQPCALAFGLRRRTARRHRVLAWTLFAVGGVAVGEFAVASLADACETSRHLFLFHVFTDASVFLALIAATELVAPALLGVLILAMAMGGIPLGQPARHFPSLSGAVDGASDSAVFAGIWRAGSFREAYGGTLTYTDQPGATARVCFEGAGLEYVYTRAPNRGLAEVAIDGVGHVVDLYDPEGVWQARTVFGGLKAGRHCATVRVLGQRSGGSSGSFVDVDRFGVR